MEQRGKAALHSAALGRAYCNQGNREGIRSEKQPGVRLGKTVSGKKEKKLWRPKNGNPYAALHTSKSLSEVERLRLIIAKQEVEIARLKKGYWVEGVGANKEYVTGKGETTKLSKK